eukprot:scaffold32685_cov43-Prasinocladus_malaysianus.AAC.4
MAGRGFFNDPFFTQDPFTRMNTMMSSMFNDPFFQSDGPFGPSMMMGGGMHPRLEQHQRSSRRRQSEEEGEGVTIEEVEDEPQQPRHGRRAQHEPTVEEPDDHRHRPTQRTQSQRQPTHRQHQNSGGSQMSSFFDMPGFNMSSNMGGGGTTMFSYSSSSYSSGGPGGVNYSTTSTHRRGPGGVGESHYQSYDGRTGEEVIKVSRSLGDKARTITRTRDAHGRERAVDDLRNIDQ